MVSEQQNSLGEVRKQFKAHKILNEKRSSKLTSYGSLIIGSTRLLDILRYELIVLLCANLPGALGLLLRSKLYPLLLGHVGKNVVFGANVTLRHPGKIWIGDNVIIDDNVMLDAKGSGNQGIVIHDSVFVGRNSILSCKDGTIILHEGANIGFNCEIFSNSTVEVGAHTMLAAYCYLVGGGSYRMDDLETPIAYQDPTRSLGGIKVGAGGWLGAKVTVVDGVDVGNGAVVGAGAVVTKSVPDYCVAAGVPARVVKDRREEAGS